MGWESVSQFEQHFLIQASKQTIFTLLYNEEEMHEHIPDLGTFVAIERVDNTSFNYIYVVLDKDIKINTLCLWNFFNMVMWPSCTFYNSAYNTIRCDKRLRQMWHDLLGTWQNPRFVRCTCIYKWFNRTLLQPHYLSDYWTVSPCSAINGSLFR